MPPLCRICHQDRHRPGRNFANLSRHFAVVRRGKDDGSKLWRTDTESEKSTEIVLAAFADCILRGWHDRCGRAFALEIAPDHSLKK
jgi:hypothetical protein